MGIADRAELAEIFAAAKAIVPVSTVGFTRRVDADQVSVLHVYEQGLGEWVVPNTAVPAVVMPSSEQTRRAEMSELILDPAGAVERYLVDQNAARVTSFDVRGATPETRFWVGMTGDQRADEEQLRGLA